MSSSTTLAQLRVASRQDIDFVDSLFELDCIKLRGDLVTADGRIGAGEVGTIVYRHAGGGSYLVEFDTPFGAVVTLRRDEIERIYASPD